MFGDMSIIQVFQSSPTMVVLLVCSIITVAFADTAYFQLNGRGNALSDVCNLVQLREF